MFYYISISDDVIYNSLEFLEFIFNRYMIIILDGYMDINIYIYRDNYILYRLFFLFIGF